MAHVSSARVGVKVNQHKVETNIKGALLKRTNWIMPMKTWENWKRSSIMFLSLLRIHWELDHIWCLNCKKVQKVERRVRTTPGSEQMQSDLQQVDRIGSHLMHWMHSKGEKTNCRRGTTKCGEKHTNLTFPRMNARSNPIFLWSTRDPIKSISDGVQWKRNPIQCFFVGAQWKRDPIWCFFDGVQRKRERALWSKQFGTGGGASAGVQVARRLIPLLYVYTSTTIHFLNL